MSVNGDAEAIKFDPNQGLVVGDNTNLGNLGRPTVHGTMVTLNHLPVHCGGTQVNDCKIYNPSANQWDTLGVMSSDLVGACGVNIKIDEFLILGKTVHNAAVYEWLIYTYRRWI